jgi:hypothetical protein
MSDKIIKTMNNQLEFEFVKPIDEAFEKFCKAENERYDADIVIEHRKTREKIGFYVDKPSSRCKYG